MTDKEKFMKILQDFGLTAILSPNIDGQDVTLTKGDPKIVGPDHFYVTFRFDGSNAFVECGSYK